METSATDKRELHIILLAAVVQGWALYALHLSVKSQHWPATEPAWLIALYAVSLIVPLSLQLLATHTRTAMAWYILGLLGVAFFYFGWHHGAAVVTLDQNGRGEFEATWPLVPVFALLILHLLPFVQCRLASGKWTPQYQQLFSVAWRNILILGEAGIFTGLFWALLFLWQGLFNMLGISFFKELFGEPIFIYPVTAITFGLALHLIGSIGRWTEMVLEQILSVLKWLAVIAGLILALFTVALVLKLPGLLFTGQRAIGAAWLLWLIAVVVLFINAAFRDGTLDRPYPNWINNALRLCMPLLVVVALTALYSLYVRSAEYGLTVARIWAFVVAAEALVYACGYTLAAARKGRWMVGIATVNRVVAVGLIAVMALLLTPVLSPYRLSANSQYQRAPTWQSDRRDADEYRNGSPLHYLRFDAGRYGRDRLAVLANSQNKELSQRALAMQKQVNRWSAQTAPDPQWLEALVVFPAGRSIDPVLQAFLSEELAKSTSPVRFNGMPDGKPAGLIIDLNADGMEEFVLFSSTRGYVYQQQSTTWKYAGTVTTQDYAAKAADLLSSLSSGKFATEVVEWRDLVIGPHRFGFEPEIAAVTVD
jgi:hypothetical protein